MTYDFAHFIKILDFHCVCYLAAELILPFPEASLADDLFSQEDNFLENSINWILN